MENPFTRGLASSSCSSVSGGIALSTNSSSYGALCIVRIAPGRCRHDSGYGPPPYTPGGGGGPGRRGPGGGGGGGGLLAVVDVNANHTVANALLVLPLRSKTGSL
jgi:hypothetical protein